MDKSLITVLMPVWNRAHLVRNAIYSILDQTFQKWEFIIIDDGSTDNTWQILKEFEKDNRFKLYRREHEGLVATLNFGNALAKSKIIIKQDSDDLSMPNRLEQIFNYWKKYPNTEFFYHAIYQTYQDENPEIIRKSFIPALPIDKKRILKEQYIPGAFAYTKDFIDKTPYRSLWCSEDWMLILDTVFRNHKIGFLNEALYDCMLQTDSNSLMHENTGHYEEDEAMMKEYLKEYRIKNFKYASRN